MKNLKKLRLERNLTQEDVSKIINKSAVAYGYYESGRSEPPIDLLLKLADFFGCSVDYLIGHQTKELLHLDSFTPAQQNIISQIKELDDHELAILEGFLFRLQQEKANPWLNRK